MLKSILIGFSLVALVCWAMGAYNRMVRLRAATIQAWAVLESLRLKLEKEYTESVHSEQRTANSLKIETEFHVQSGVYGLAVTQYNEAIVQIPASWLANLFGFKPIKKKLTSIE